MPIQTLPHGIKLYYHQQGQGEDLILVSGLASTHHSWDLVIDALAQHFRVTVFDNRGVGQSSVPTTPYSVAQMANDIKALMMALSIQSTYIVGHSLGGHIVQHLLADHPQGIQKAILLCTKKSGAKRSILFRTLSTFCAPRKLLIRAAMRRLFSQQFLENPDQVKWFINHVKSQRHPITAMGYKHQLKAASTHNATDKLAHIHCPVLSVGCQQDRMIPAESAQELAGLIPEAQFELIPNCGHVPQFECPEILIEIVINFLNNPR